MAYQNFSEYMDGESAFWEKVANSTGRPSENSPTWHAAKAIATRLSDESIRALADDSPTRDEARAQWVDEYGGEFPGATWETVWELVTAWVGEYPDSPLSPGQPLEAQAISTEPAVNPDDQDKPKETETIAAGEVGKVEDVLGEEPEATGNPKGD